VSSNPVLFSPKFPTRKLPLIQVQHIAEALVPTPSIFPQVSLPSIPAHYRHHGPERTTTAGTRRLITVLHHLHSATQGILSILPRSLHYLILFDLSFIQSDPNYSNPVQIAPRLGYFSWEPNPTSYPDKQTQTVTQQRNYTYILKRDTGRRLTRLLGSRDGVLEIARARCFCYIGRRGWVLEFGRLLVMVWGKGGELEVRVVRDLGS
jgi:hypothetical protein